MAETLAADLVARLRERAGKYDEYDWHGAIELEAAEEVERLRTMEARYIWLRRQYALGKETYLAESISHEWELDKYIDSARKSKANG